MDIRAVSENTLDNSFLGNTIQVCVVSHDLERTLEGMARTGIGPWAIHTFNSGNVADMTYRGQPADWEVRLAIAWSGEMMWEVIQPLRGRTIHADFLERHGEGLHHVLVDCNGVAWEEREGLFAAHGYSCSQSGSWEGRVPFAYYETEGDITTTIETAFFPEDFPFPEPERWYPGPPPGR